MTVKKGTKTVMLMVCIYGNLPNGIVIFLFNLFRIWLDENILMEQPLILPHWAILFCFVGLYNVIRQVNNINKIINEQINYVLKYCIPFTLLHFAQHYASTVLGSQQMIFLHNLRYLFISILYH
jgi:hypothetical protein